jgi:hypothetical protein
MSDRAFIRIIALGFCTMALPACVSPQRDADPYANGPNFWTQASAAPAPVPPSVGQSRYLQNGYYNPQPTFARRAAPATDQRPPAVPAIREPVAHPVQPVAYLVNETAEPAQLASSIREAADDAVPELLPPPTVIRDDEAPLVTAIRRYLEKHPESAIDCLRAYDHENQDILLCLLPIIARMADGDVRQINPREMAQVLDQLESLVESLRSHASMSIDKACFCRNVKRFGVYEALGDEVPSFHRGEMAEIYAEIRNVTCKMSQGACAVHISSKLEIRDQAGRVVLQKSFEIPEKSRSLRHDYYQHYQFQIPPEPGTYAVALEVVDHPTRRVAKHQLRFRVVD